MESILAYNSRTRFFPDMYLVQICLAYPIIYTIQFFKTQLCHFKVYLAKYPYAKN